LRFWRESDICRGALVPDGDPVRGEGGPAQALQPFFQAFFFGTDAGSFLEAASVNLVAI